MITRHHTLTVGRPFESRFRRSICATKSSFVSHPSRDQLYAEGKRLRDKCPRQSHAIWKAPDNRPDPLSLMIESSKGRIPQLIPIRYGRMMQSPFTFYRGAALNMAEDLANTAVSGLRACRASAGVTVTLLTQWRLCHPGTTGNLRYKRSGRNVAGTLGVGR